MKAYYTEQTRVGQLDKGQEETRFHTTTLDLGQAFLFFTTTGIKQCQETNSVWQL